MSKTQSPKNFWAQVAKAGPDDCWDWQGSCNNTGYGTVAWYGKVYVAHRLAAWLECMVDTISVPDSPKHPQHVLHRCDNRKCCNPNHFFLGSYTDNALDAYEKGRKTQPRGFRHVNAKLTEAQVAEVRARYEGGEVQKALATAFGVSQTAISGVVRGATYL